MSADALGLIAHELHFDLLDDVKMQQTPWTAHVTPNAVVVN